MLVPLLQDRQGLLPEDGVLHKEFILCLLIIFINAKARSYGLNCERWCLLWAVKQLEKTDEWLC